mgnify:FL=1
MTNAKKLTKALNSYIAAFYEMAPTGGTAGYQQLHHNSARQFSEWKDGEFEDEHSTTGPIKLGANYWDNVSNINPKAMM